MMGAIRFALGAALATFLSTAAIHAAPADPILEIYNASLTDYRPNSASNIQDIQPTYAMRGVNLDGSLRSSSPLGMSLAGNPFSTPWRDKRLNNVNLATGMFVIEDVDLALPTSGPKWTIARSYAVRQKTSGGSYRDSDSYQGKNWHQSSQPEIVLYEHPSDDDLDLVHIIYGADRYVAFKRVDIETGTSDTFKATNGAAGIVYYVEGATDEPDTYTYTDQRGVDYVFFGFDADADPAEGSLWKIVDPAGNTAYIGDDTTGSTAISNGYDASGRVEYAYDDVDRRYTYTYSSVGGGTRLTKVEAETKSGGTWASPTGLETVGEVDYTYYENESYGDQGDLKTVTITTPMTDSGVELEKTKYYRYWEGSYDAGSNPGYPHALKYIYDFEGVRQYDWDDSNFDDDHLTASNATLDVYSSAYFEYDSEHRINEGFFNGECGCGGGANGTYTIEYEDNGSYSDGGGYDEDEWMVRAVVERPDGAYETHYYDEVHQALSRVLTDGDPDGSPDTWVTRAERNQYGSLETLHTPANLDTYNHSTGAITGLSGAGLMRTYAYETTGEVAGFHKSVKWHEGTGAANQYLESQLTYSTEERIDGGWDAGVVRPFKEDISNYSERITSGTSGEETRTLTTTVHTGKVATKQVTSTKAEVPTSENGSGTADDSDEYYDETGRVTFARDPGDIIEYREYTNGQLTKVIADADTSDGDVTATVPTGFSSSGTELHHKTTHTYDAQGRREETTLPNGRVTKNYYTKLADGRSVVLRFPRYVTSPSTKFYGPVSYTVYNHAGQAEVQATIGLTNNESTTALTGHIDETDSDPILAADLGDLVRLTVNVYNETGGTLDESRTYFDIPASGAGVDGTNYDPMVYGYDDMGRRWRTKEASGTIRRMAYDSIGRVQYRYIGTNDSTFDGGEPSGTDNMVKIEELVYDSGADDGNSYVTKRTAFVEDGTTDKRETTYEHDARGNVLLETRPLAPHYFHRYDNMDRRDATAVYSSVASITASSDDPTTEATNRLQLSRTYYDTEGRVWKTTRHKIDRDDGSDDDNLETLHWYDEDGRRVKTEGEQLTKTRYDRLGRQTHSFVLAVDDDYLYAHADDLDGDIVLEESQRVYEDDSNNVLMRATIERFHDDKGTLETLNELDTNADGDDLLYTAANVAGRIQITAMWYDSQDRLEDVVQYGTYGGSTFDRDGLSVPARSDTALRTTYSYTTSGQRETVEDPKGIVAKFEYDDAGRQTKSIRNYDAGVNSGNPSGSDDNVTVKYEYTDGLRTKVIADLPSGSTDQETTYTYGVTKGASAGDSEISAGHLLQEIEYPDSASASDVVTFAYNAQGEQIWKEDQAGNIIETDRDDEGRAEHTRITTLDGDFDGSVRRISRTWTDAGELELVTQYDNAAVGSGTLVNEVRHRYDDWAMLEYFEQDRNSAVDASGSVDDYEVRTRWVKATGGRNTLRLEQMDLPSGNQITYEYLSLSDLHDAEASRVTRIKDGSVALAFYAYNGVGSVVLQDYPEPDIMWAMHGSTSGDYPDLDRFNRVTTSKWTKDLGTDVNFYEVDLTYDRNGNITLAEDNVHSGFDVEYTIDDLNRVTQAEEGTWGGSSITTTSRDQQWTLDQVGNWDVDKLDLDGDGNFTGTDELNDDRTHNDANELTARDIDDDNTDDYTLVYDEVGNLTDDDEDYKYEYDPFGRLRKVKATGDSSLVAEYVYNGLGHRISYLEDTDTDDDVDGDDKWYHIAYDAGWRQVAVFRENDSDPKEEFVNHQAGLSGRGGSSYIDLVVCRDKDANTDWTAASDGVLEERVYYCQNWATDVSAIVGSAGETLEWEKYSPSGTPFGLPGGDTDSNGNCDSTDSAQVQSWVNAFAYDVRGDLDLDGDVDGTDKSLLESSFLGKSGGRGSIGIIAAHRKGSRGRVGSIESQILFARAAPPTSPALGRVLPSPSWRVNYKLELRDDLNYTSRASSISPITWPIRTSQAASILAHGGKGVTRTPDLPVHNENSPGPGEDMGISGPYLGPPGDWDDYGEACWFLPGLGDSGTPPKCEGCFVKTWTKKLSGMPPGEGIYLCCMQMHCNGNSKNSPKCHIADQTGCKGQTPSQIGFAGCRFKLPDGFPGPDCMIADGEWGQKP